MADWDDDDFDLPAVVQAPAFDDEEEEGDVKESWEDDEPVKKEAPVIVQKTIRDFSDVELKNETERRKNEAKKAARMARLKAGKGAEDDSERLEDPFAEKLRLQQLQIDGDVEISKETFGSIESIDAFVPKGAQGFVRFALLLSEKIREYEKEDDYVDFCRSLFKNLSSSLPAEDIKELVSALNSLANEKFKQEKEARLGKKKTKAAGKDLNVAPVKSGVFDASLEQAGALGGDEEDDDFDFM